jgi:hypothetical protein
LRTPRSIRLLLLAVLLASTSVAAAPRHRAPGLDLRRRDQSAQVFSAFSQSEVRSLVGNLWGILPQRGCIQRCAGCHACSLPVVATASWPVIDAALRALAGAARSAGLKVQSAVPNALFETFRDSDPVHLTAPDRARARGIGDFSAAIARRLGVPAKIMTSGARAGLQPDASGRQQLVVDARDLRQLEQAARHAGSVSVSISTETLPYRRLGAEADARVLARTAEAALRRAGPETRVYLDLTYRSRDGSDERTQATKALYRQVVRELDPALVPEAQKAAMLAHLEESIDGSQNSRWMLPGLPRVGVRVSPFLTVGRAVKAPAGQGLPGVTITDGLGVRPGKPGDRIGLRVGGRRYSFTRSELADPARRHELCELLRQVRGDGFLAERVKLDGNWLSFFRGELDLSPALTGLPEQILKRSPGTNLPPGVNLLLSDPVSGEIQVVVPFKRLYLEEATASRRPRVARGALGSLAAPLLGPGQAP